MHKKSWSPKLNAFLDALARDFILDSVILFGSRARKDHLEHSDFDLLVIGSFEDDFLERLRRVIHLKPWGIHIDAIPVTPAEFDSMLRRFDPIALEAASIGVPLQEGPAFEKAQKIYQFYKNHGLQRRKWSWKLPVDSKGQLVPLPENI